MNKSKQLREQIELLVNKAWARGANWASKGYGYAMDTDAEQELEEIVKEVDKALTNQRKAILEEVRSVLPKEIENRYGMISPDVGYKQAIKEMRQKLSTLEGKQND